MIKLSIDNACNTNIDKIIITGDLNCNQLRDAYNDITDINDTFNMTQLIKEPTHYTENSSTLLDLILVNDPSFIVKAGVGDPFLPNDVRYHCPVFAFLNTNKAQNHVFKRKIWSFKNTDFTAYRQALENTLWDELICEDVNLSANNMTDVINQSASLHIPNKVVTIRKNDPPWFNNSIRKIIRCRKRAHRKAKRTNNPDHWAKFRSLRNKSIATIRTCKEHYFNNLTEKLVDEHTDPKNWWKVAKLITNIDGSKKEIPPLISNNTLYESDQDKTELFNNYFIAQSTINDDNIFPPDINEGDYSLGDIHISETDVSDVLRLLNTSKASGPDQINPTLLKEASAQLCKPLSKLFNNSLTSGKFPESWKEANVTPIYKKDDPSLVNNYRPISLLNILGKVMERCVFKHVYNYLQSKSIISQLQSGFQPKDSTINQLLDVSNQFGKALDEGKEIRVVFCDISKAFDRVWHAGLIKKLESIGIKNNLLLWFSDYLKHRRQRVVINGVSSSWEEINAGVPQGSILGPLLFLIYINDIVNDIETNIRLFADDTSLYIIVENPQSSADFLNNDLEKIHNWSNAWLVDFNPNKTESLIISRKHNPPFRPTLYMDNTPIREVESHKHLGLTFDSNGTWDAHIETIITKASKRIGLLRKIKFKIDRFSLQKIYFSFIRPILEYADIIWDGCNQTMKARLERIHFEAARIITGASKLASIESLLTETGWDTLQNRRYKHKLILFHKMFHKQTPDYLASLVPFSAHEIHGRNTRNQHQLVNINCRTESYRNSFLPSVIKAWNDLPVDIRNNPSLWSLKNFLNRNLSKNPTYFNCGSRIGQIYHARLRTNSGPLNDHLYKCNLSDSPLCRCGARETSKHFLTACPIYTDIRRDTISGLRDISLNNLLFGNPLLSNEDNVHTFKVVHEFILKSKRFAVQ